MSMRILRSGRILPDPQFNTSISSNDTLSHSAIDPLLNASMADSSSPVANSRSRRSLMLCDNGGIKRKFDCSSDLESSSGDMVRSVRFDYAERKEIGDMCLRSGSRVSRVRIGDGCVDSVLVNRISCREVKDMIFINDGANESECIKMKDGLNMAMSGIDDGVSNVERSEIGFCNREDESTGKLILEDSEDVLYVDPNPEVLHEKGKIGDVGTYQRRSRRYSREEKGKEKLVSKELKFADEEQVTLQDEEFTDVNGSEKLKIGSIQGKFVSRREAARNTAIELAPQYAFFKADEEGSEEVEEDDSIPDSIEEDWPGPFSTAMKIIAESKINAQSMNFSSLKDGEAGVKISWTPSNVKRNMNMGNLTPSLKDLCLKVLCENAEEIESLEGLPDAIKHNIVMLLCHSRRMSSRFLGLLTKGSPLEIYLSDCSWATDKLFEEVFSQCNINNLKVLQLDFCGRCLPDYVLHSTFAKSPNCLPSLHKLSLKGAYCLSDGGLHAIAVSAPCLMSLNLSQCPLITSKGIFALAEKLETVLQELYIDVCHNVDAMLILPALKKLKCLDVLSVAHMETVTDKFLKSLIPIFGPKMRVLNIASCRKLTNASMKVIGANCPQLSCLDIRNLDRLNDSAIQHLVNGGCSFQTFKLCHGAFRFFSKKQF